MNKILDYIVDNAVKIVLISILLFVIFIGGLSIYRIQSDLNFLSEQITLSFSEQTAIQETISDRTFNGLRFIVEQLQEIIKQQQFIIDQNRENDNKTITIKERIKKPTYESLKAHTVYIIGCSGKTLTDTEKEGMCWGGTGVVIKINDTETYVLTNNHVSGAGQEDVHLYIENNKENINAELVAHHPTVDAAVIKVQGKLEGKTQITKISTVSIQDPVYVVGNPLSNKMTYSEGVVANFINTDILIQIPLIFGNSGSGIYNANGELVGLCYALQIYPGFMGLPMPQITHSLCVDNVSIKAFLQDLKLYNEN